MTVSILICTYGDPKWSSLAARRALPSASNQGAQEVIVRHETDGTLADCRNETALKAIGEWLCFLDADDELGRGYIAAMEQAIRELGQAVSSVSLLVPAVQYVDVIREVEIGGTSETGLITKSHDPRILNTGRPLCELNRAVIGTLVPRELFLHLGGFRADLPIYEDWEAWLRCERAGAELIDVPDAIYRAYRRPGSRNTTDPRAIRRYYWEIRRAYERKTA